MTGRADNALGRLGIHNHNSGGAETVGTYGGPPRNMAEVWNFLRRVRSVKP